jgi:serine/threonine protein kinase/tetratricopeptide (TPR) repeat protein
MELIAKKYRVLKSLGQGAMGEVYLVLPPRGDAVALKLLKSSDKGNAGVAIEQFENEFKVLKKLSHPGIGQIYDYGYDEEQKKVYFTSPWLKGTDLFVATKDCPVEKIEDYFVQVLRACNYLHQKDIIHCDLKPGNVFVENDQILLIDFGLAGYWGESIVGTPTYLAPEIFRGERHSVSSDLYALGVMMYNCLARTQPFSGKNLQEIYDRHRTHTPMPLTELNRHIPRYLSDIALTLLSKKSQERYPSAVAVIEEISAYSKTTYSVETRETLLSYLPKTSELIGRKDAQWQIEDLVASFLSEEGEETHYVLFLFGEAGLGKTKFVSQIKTRLQLEKVSVEEAVLPLTESDRKVLEGSKAVILEDVSDYFVSSASKTRKSENVHPATTLISKALNEFILLLERRVLSPDTEKNFIIFTSLEKEDAAFLNEIYPVEGSRLKSIELTPFNREDTREFLESIIGQKQIPEKFVAEVYRNTGGNPAICQQTIENLIQQGLLFDESGRWSADLLAHLEDALGHVETPRSLEEKMKLEYESLDSYERDVVCWLSLSPFGLSEKALKKLVGVKKVSRVLKEMLNKKIVRLEQKQAYMLYRSTFGPFVRRRLSEYEKQARHDELAGADLGFPEEMRLYHRGYGSHREAGIEALEKLGDSLALKGDRAGSLKCFKRLHDEFDGEPVADRVRWVIKLAENLIWLDRFREASAIIAGIDQEIIDADDATVSLKSRLLLWEKQGLSLLHQQRIKEASFYFSEGLRLSSKNPDTRVEEIRFLNDLAQIEMLAARHEKAIEKFNEARKKAKGLGQEEMRRITNNDLGHVYFGLGEYDKAVDYLKEDIDVFSRLRFQEPLTRAIYTVAECLRAKKHYDKAIKEYERCIRICKRENLLPLLLRSYNGLGNVFLTKEKYDKALENYQRAIEISVHLKDFTTRAALLSNQALIYRIQKNWTQAARRFLLVKQILESKSKRIPYEQTLLSKCYSELAEIAREENNPMKAIGIQAERARMVEQSPTLKLEAFSVNLELARLYLDNRIGGPFENEIKKLKVLAKTDEEKAQVEALEKNWEDIQGADHDSTVSVSLDQCGEV